MGRITIAGLLGFVAVFAVGLAALVNATFVWAGVVFTLTIGLLLASVLAVILRGWRQGGWLGFALFGWGFFLIACFGLSSYTWILPDAAAEWIFLKSNPEPVPPNPPTVSQPGSSPEPSASFEAGNVHDERSTNAKNIGHWLWILLFAEVGAILGVLLARGRRAGEVAPAAAPTVS